MKKTIELMIDKLYRYDRKLEPCFIGFPLKEGTLNNINNVSVYDGDRILPLQAKATSLYKDGSVRFLFLRFLADIPANKGLKLRCELTDEAGKTAAADSWQPVKAEKTAEGWKVLTADDQTGDAFSYEVRNGSDSIFETLSAHGRSYTAKQLSGPYLRTPETADDYSTEIDTWNVVENGPVCVILKAKGTHKSADGAYHADFEVKLTAWAGKPYTEVSYRIINTSDDPLEIKSLRYQVFNEEGYAEKISGTEGVVPVILKNSGTGHLDSTGCGDSLTGSKAEEGPLYHAGNSADAEKMAEDIPLERIRTVAAASNYKTDYFLGRDGETVHRVIDGKSLLTQANEHFAEVFHGTFFADSTDADGGVCATIFQAHQNYPKAIEADGNGVTLMLVPEGVDKVVLQSGMAREQKFLLHFHKAEESITSLNDRSIVYQMPYRPYVSPQVHRESGVWPDLFADANDYRFEQNMVARADGHCRAYGMMNFGDSYDSNYTEQGRGGGRLVWCNNEYDYPHACALQYARTGIRRFLDYTIASCSHWMDVDVCHYHKDPLYIGGQWEHTAGHIINGVMVCSHEWVEGLLDYYHLTGDERGLETALGIGENVLRLLKMPMYAKAGEANARETGWALRTLTALYVETQDEKWLARCDKIINDFKVWEEQYGHWLAPYTDNTIIRVPFMIAVAIGSLMRYYRHFPDPELKALILRAVDDMIENCYVKDWGIFYYKDLPSLDRLGGNTLVLEALTAAYDLSGDKEYLTYGIGTFRNAIAEDQPYNTSKRQVEDTVLVGNASTKIFAQSMIPLTGFYRAGVQAGLKLI